MAGKLCFLDPLDRAVDRGIETGGRRIHRIYSLYRRFLPSGQDRCRRRRLRRTVALASSEASWAAGDMDHGVRAAAGAACGVDRNFHSKGEPARGGGGLQKSE